MPPSKAWPRIQPTGASPMTATAASSRCIPMSCWVSITPSSRTSSAASRTSAATASTPKITADEWHALIIRYKALVAEHTGKSLPAGCDGAALGGCRRRVQVVEWRARYYLPQAQQHSGRLGHCRQRPGHGIRQHGRYQRDRCRLHPQPVDRCQGTLRRVPRQCAGRGCGGRHPHTAEHHRARQTRGGKRCPLA